MLVMYKLVLKHVNGRIIHGENRFGEILLPDGSHQKKTLESPPMFQFSNSESELVEYARSIVAKHPLTTAIITRPDGSERIVEDSKAIDEYYDEQKEWYEKRKRKWRWEIELIGFFGRIFRKVTK